VAAVVHLVVPRGTAGTSVASAAPLELTVEMVTVCGPSSAVERRVVILVQ
jgi:hypothetical protein